MRATLFRQPSFFRRLSAAWLIGVIAVTATLPATAASNDMQQFTGLVQLMTGYYKLIGEIKDVASDSDKTAILEMTKLKDALQGSGQPERVVLVLREISAHHPSQVVRNAAVVMLSDALSDQGNKREAAAVLERALKVSVPQQ